MIGNRFGRKEKIEDEFSFFFEQQEQEWCHLLTCGAQRSIFRVGKEGLVIYSGHIKFEMHIKYPSLRGPVKYLIVKLREHIVAGNRN